MEPTDSVTIRSKNRFFKGLRTLCSSTGNKVNCFKPSKADADAISSSSETHSNIPQQFSAQHLYLEQCSNEGSPFPTNEANCVGQRRPNIDTLPDLILLHLFKYLNAQDLCNLGWCAPNLCKVARRQKNYWQNVHHVCNGSSPCHKLLRPFLSDCYKLHLSKANVSSSDIVKAPKDTCLEPNFFASLKNLANLRSLTLEDHSLKYEFMFNLKWLPKSLTELSLKRITLLNLNGEQCLAFEDLHFYLPNLEVVDVSHCSWMNSHILCSLSWFPRLRKLIMFGCSEFKYVMPYLVTATDSGFEALETLDLRLTYATLYDIKVFKTLKNLKHILLEKPNQTSREGFCRRADLLYSNRLDFNKELQVFQLQPSTPATVNPANNTRSRIFRLSEYFSGWLVTLVVRNYSEITDSILQEIETFTSIKYLDLTGTQCTAQRVAIFQFRRPEVQVVHECCPKLYNIIHREKKFWKNIHAVCSGCPSCYIRLLPFLSDLTTALHISKSIEVPLECEDRIEPYFLKKLKHLPHLRSFGFENHSIRYKHLLNHLRCPPKWSHLTELRLKRINLLGLNGQPCLAFEDVHLYLPNVEVVDVSHCSWATSDILWSLSKCSHLKTLIMVGCNEIEYIVPPYIQEGCYPGESWVTGFVELETLNLRLTDVTFEEIGVFMELKNLKHIYLEKPERNSMSMTEELKRRKKMYDYYANLDSWWGVPTYIIGDHAIGAIRVFLLSDVISKWLETLVARNYTEITDFIIEDVEENLKSIKYLDITGTRCTEDRVASFQIRCPEVTVCHDSICNFENHKLPNY